MDGKYSKMIEWRCAKGHVLGYIDKVKMYEMGHEYKETRLFVLRHAIDQAADTPAEVDVMATIVGTTMDVACDVPDCCEKKSWYVNEAALQRLLDRMALRNARAVG